MVTSTVTDRQSLRRNPARCEVRCRIAIAHSSASNAIATGSAEILLGSDCLEPLEKRRVPPALRGQPSYSVVTPAMQVDSARSAMFRRGW